MTEDLLDASVRKEFPNVLEANKNWEQFLGCSFLPSLFLICFCKSLFHIGSFGITLCPILKKILTSIKTMFFVDFSYWPSDSVHHAVNHIIDIPSHKFSSCSQG